MTKEIMLQLVQAQLIAYNSRNLNAFVECFHKEVHATQLTANQPPLIGIEEFRARYLDLFQNNPNLHCEIKNRTVLGSTIVDEEIVTGITKSPQSIHAIAIYAFRENKIDRVWFAK